jgi:DNA replication and repair protein RecF
MLSLLRLTLTDFRNFASLRWQPASRLAVITGPNGAGKTNLLEAVSLLAPGRGLRGARIAELARHGGSGRWAVAARLRQGEAPPFDLGSGTLGDGPADRRAFRLDGAEPRTQADIAARFGTVWLTPQMDGLFGESASGRRRFLDRLVWALEPGHARDSAAHDTAVASRNRLLATRPGDASWLAGVEESIARHAVAVAAARRAFVAHLNAAPLPFTAFPRAHLVLLDPIAERLGEQPDGGCGELVHQQWRPSRRPRDVRCRNEAPGRAGEHRPAQGFAAGHHPGARLPDRRSTRDSPHATARRAGGAPGRSAARGAVCRPGCAAGAGPFDRDGRGNLRATP